MEEWVGGLWHRFITRRAGGHYPEAAVALGEVDKTLGILFRAFGGDGGLTVSAAALESHGARRTWLKRLAGSGERTAPARRDGEALRLPPEIACFPVREHNRDLYLWLAGLAASPHTEDFSQPWIVRNQRAAVDTLARYPGLRPRYAALVAACLAERIAPEALPPDEAAQEAALRQALADPGTVAGLPPLTSRQSRPPQPVPLWLGWPGDTPDDGSRPPGAAYDALPPEGGGGHGKADDGKRRHKAEREEAPDNEDALMLCFRAESLLSWAEYVKVNRPTDDEPDPQAAQAANDMEQLSVAQDGQTTAGRVRFDLDLPSAAEDDAPLGPGIPLPEWDYRKNALLPGHVRLQPLLAANAAPTPLPEALVRPAKKLRQQFAALAPQRRWLKQQPDGPELDLDACVRWQADRRAGHTGSGRDGLYLAQVPQARELACLLLADLSLSTDAWVSDHQRIVDVIRDGLMLFAEALAGSGDAFGIYGFSSLKRGNVRFHVLKDFAEPYGDIPRGRLQAIKPGYYTRMGAAIRQSANILAERREKQRLLLIITDGKPNDLDVYDSRYGLEDTRAAVFEAKRLGLQPFCVTVDREGADYLPHLFGPAGYTVIRNPDDLPRRLPLLYAQLTRQP